MFPNLLCQFNLGEQSKVSWELTVLMSLIC